MIGRARSRRLNSDASWPGFVDALSSLLLVLIFLLSMFVLAQFFLGRALTGRDEALAQLRGQVAQLGNLLKLEQQANTTLRDSISSLSASLTSANADRDKLGAELATVRENFDQNASLLSDLTQERDLLTRQLETLTQSYNTASDQLTAEQEISDRAKGQIARLEANLTALRDQLSRLESALEASEERDRRNQTVIVDLGRRLNTALAGKVEELAGYRSEFFGRLKDVLSSRPEIRVEGDRFVFASELLFASGSAELGDQGRDELRKLAETLIVISNEIPSDLNWILRVDGHTDKNPISTATFQSNWELSAARAIAVVRFLILTGIPAERLAATGFGEYQPLETSDDPAALARNRRIEMRLTQR